LGLGKSALAHADLLGKSCQEVLLIGVSAEGKATTPPPATSVHAGGRLSTCTTRGKL
jgi:hypothetical protein